MADNSTGTAIGGIGAGVGGIGGSIAGSLLSAQQSNAATAAQAAAVQQWLSINVPDPKQQAIELQNYQVTGQLSPQLETAFQQQQSNLKNMSIDPTSRAAEVQALTQMQDLANNGGMDAQAKQQESQAINTSNANEQGQRGAIVQNAAARGVGGSGAQLAAELEASQGDANQAAASGQSAAAAAQQRALQAMTSASTMGSTLNNQDYGQAAAAATAQDAINKFNTQTQQTTSNANTTAENQAQASNLQNAQNISNLNTGVANTEETTNKGLIEKQFQNEEGIASGVANAEKGVASQANTNADNTSSLWGNIGSAISQGAGAIGQAYSGKSTSDNTDDDSED